MKPGVFIKTFGCQMNEYDSEKVAFLLSPFYRKVRLLEEAELVFINTCSVRQKSEEKLFSMLGKLRKLKQGRPELIIGVGGCVAQQEGELILKRNTAVDFVVGTHNLSLIPALVQGVKQGLRRQVAVDYREEWEDIPLDFSAESDTSVQGQSAVRALVAIQRGCNKNCSYCVVPRTRGAALSRHPAEIEREIKLKLRRGAREVLLLGQTVNSYGRDLDPAFDFAQLIKRIASLEGLKRIRFTSPHPAELRPELIELYGTVAQLMPHIHLPLQSGSDRILRLMRRGYRLSQYLQIVDKLRARVPELAVSSDLIVGFPTETEEEFEETLKVMEEVRFHASYSFCYSFRPNTEDSRRFCPKDAVAQEVAAERLKRLQELQDRISLQRNQELLARQVEILVEIPAGHISSSARGRTPQNTLVEIIGEGLLGGEIVQVKIEHASPHGLRGRVVQGESWPTKLAGGMKVAEGPM